MKRILYSALFSFFPILMIFSTIVSPNAVSAGDSIRLYYKPPAQIELISAAGTRVLLDVVDPKVLSVPPGPKDVLLTTHNHGDHRRLDFVKSFPGRQLDVKSGEIKLADTTIRGIAATHNQGYEFRSEGGSNYIFIVDMDGLRIAHFGDIGQDALTAKQLEALGKVDIAITQLSNQFSGMNAANKMGFNLMDQLKPKLIIPTHVYEPACTKMAIKKWKAYNFYKRYVTLSRDKLPTETTIVFMGPNAFATKLPPAGF